MRPQGHKYRHGQPAESVIRKHPYRRQNTTNHFYEDSNPEYHNSSNNPQHYEYNKNFNNISYNNTPQYNQYEYQPTNNSEPIRAEKRVECVKCHLVVGNISKHDTRCHQFKKWAFHCNLCYHAENRLDINLFRKHMQFSHQLNITNNVINNDYLYNVPSGYVELKKCPITDCFYKGISEGNSIHHFNMAHHITNTTIVTPVTHTIISTTNSSLSFPLSSYGKPSTIPSPTSTFSTQSISYPISAIPIFSSVKQVPKSMLVPVTQSKFVLSPSLGVTSKSYSSSKPGLDKAAMAMIHAGLPLAPVVKSESATAVDSSLAAACEQLLITRPPVARSLFDELGYEYIIID